MVDENIVDKSIVNRLNDNSSFVLVPGTKDHPKFGVSLDRYFCGSNFGVCVDGASSNGGFVLSLALGVEFYRLLRSNDTLFLADGSKMSDSRRSSVVEDIFSRRNPYRAEFFDTRFGNGNVKYSKLDSSGSLVEVTEELGDCLMVSRKIDLDYWLNNVTPQGLPPKNALSGDLIYFNPLNGTVAGFGASSVWVSLGCYGDPQDSFDGLGVHVAKIFDK